MHVKHNLTMHESVFVYFFSTCTILSYHGIKKCLATQRGFLSYDTFPKTLLRDLSKGSVTNTLK